jgi:hypothetical protein
MTEERKFTILFAATMLAARKLIEMEPDKPNMAKGYGRRPIPTVSVLASLYRLNI